jgi:hypothetical protein
MTLTEKIKPFVQQIIEDADKGNPQAQQVIALHRMHVSCPSDPAAPALCETAFDEWKKMIEESKRGE